MPHFLQAVVLSAWPWQIYLFAPCFLSLHSHSMTNVKRISSLHENSHSTRTKRVNRMAVIQTVSKLTDTHVPQSQSRSCRSCRSDRGIHRCVSGPQASQSPFLLPVIMITSCHLCFLLFCWITVRGILTWMLISQQERSQVTVVHFHMTCHHMVILYAPVFPPEIM